VVRSLSPDTRDEIVRATLRCMGERDFAAITTRDLAQAAGISEATLFRYFPKKDEILRTIFTDLTRAFLAELDQAVGLVDGPVERLRAVCRTHARFGAKNRDLLLIVKRECSYGMRRNPKLFEGLRKFLDRLQGLIRDGIAAGELYPDTDCEAAALALHSIVPTTLMADRVVGSEPFTEEQFLAHAETLLRLYLRALCKEGPKERVRR
jgi:AcrR family transcriptional regulator